MRKCIYLGLALAGFVVSVRGGGSADDVNEISTSSITNLYRNLKNWWNKESSAGSLDTREPATLVDESDARNSWTHSEIQESRLASEKGESDVGLVEAEEIRAEIIPGLPPLGSGVKHPTADRAGEGYNEMLPQGCWLVVSEKNDEEKAMLSSIQSTSRPFWLGESQAAIRIPCFNPEAEKHSALGKGISKVTAEMSMSVLGMTNPPFELRCVAFSSETKQSQVKYIRTPNSLNCGATDLKSCWEQICIDAVGRHQSLQDWMKKEQGKTHYENSEQLN